MTKCLRPADKIAIIISQSDYTLTKRVCDTFSNLPTAKSDAKHATQIARGFGIRDADIYYIRDMPLQEVKNLWNKIKKRI